MAFEDEDDDAVEADEGFAEVGVVAPVALLAGGVFTVNWLPVTTVTSAPSAT